ncbi:MAG: hypothetical protein ACLQBJ_14900 [Bryobacteraceae bacterium]
MTLSIAFRPALRNWIRASAVLLLCASTVALYGFDDKEKKPAEKPKPAAKPAPKPTPQVKSSGGGNASPVYNKTPVTNPNLYKQPATTTTNPNLNRPVTNPNLYKQPATTTTNPNLYNRPVTPNANPNLNNHSVTSTATPLNNRQNINSNVSARAVTPSGYRAPALNTTHLPPGSQVTRGPGGITNVTTRTGGQFQLNPQGRVTSFHAPNGAAVNFRPNGAPAVVHTASGATVIHNNYGGRTIIVNRPNNTVIVAHPGGMGYVQRPFAVGGRPYIQRTYVVNNVRYTRVYASYNYYGHSYPFYVRPRFYRPAFYGWAFNPWARPVAFGWGWGMGTPWFGFYAGFWQPYPVYRSPAFWLTDYLFSATLMAAYQERMADQAAVNAQANAGEQNQMMSDQVKQMVADEVQRQLAQARDESQAAAQNSMAPPPSNGLPSAFTDGGPHALVVYNALDVNNGASGCPLSEGDVVAFNGSLPQGADAMNVRVVASRGQDCPTGSTVAVQIADLMEMENHLRATLDQGMDQMQSDAGHGGLPAVPSNATGYINTAVGSAAPPPDPNAATELSSQAQAATQEEQAVLNQASDTGGGGAGTGPAVSLGMTLDQVRGIVGDLRLVANVGNKQIYQGGGLKITFVDGQVSNVE